MIRPIVRGIAQGIARGISPGGGAADALVFHAFDDVAGTFSADVIVGTGSVTEGRTSTNYAPDASGVYQAFGSGVPIKEYANSKWWVRAEPARTNSITWSRDLTNVAWTPIGTSVAAYDAVGMQGDANGASTLTDDDGASSESTSETITIPDDSNTNVLRLFIDKDADTSRFPEFRLRLRNGTEQNSYVRLNTSTGATSEITSTGTTSVDVRDAGNWWELLISVANNGTGNTSALIQIYPAAAGTIGGGADASSTGSIIVGNAELHLNVGGISAVRGSSPIFTSGSAVSTVAVDGSFDPSNIPATGAVYFELLPRFSTSEVSGDIELLSLNGAADLVYYDATNSQVESNDGTNTAVKALTLTAGTSVQIGLAYGGSNMRINVDGTWGTEAAFDGGFTAGAALEFLDSLAQVGLIRNIRAYSQSYAEGQTTITGLMP